MSYEYSFTGKQFLVDCFEAVMASSLEKDGRALECGAPWDMVLSGDLWYL